MVQIQRNTSSWRSSEDLADMDFSQAAELLGSNLDLSDDMSLMGMDNLFDDVDDVIRDDRDIFMGCTEDSQLKNDIFMSCDSSDQGILSYGELSPEAVPYDGVTSPLHSSSDESQDTASYSGGLTPESDIMDSDIMETEEQICDESVIPLVALEITGAISPLKDTNKRPTRRKAATTKAGGIRKRRSPAVKAKPAKTVRGRGARSRAKQVVSEQPDVQCVKVCPPVNDKPSTNFSPSTLFPTIMSALRTNPANTVPLERLVKPKTVEQPDISCIQTPPTTPVELKPSAIIGAPHQEDKEAVQNIPNNDIKPSAALTQTVQDVIQPEIYPETETSTLSISTVVRDQPLTPESLDLEMKDSELDKQVADIDALVVQNYDLPEVDENQNDQKTDIDSKNNHYVTSRGGKLVRIPSPTRMTTRGIRKRRPSIAAKTKNEHLGLPKVHQNLPAAAKVSQTVVVEKQVTTLPEVPKKEVVPLASVVSMPPQCTSPNAQSQNSQMVLPKLPLNVPLQTRTVSVPPIQTVCSKAVQLSSIAKPSSVTVVSSTARLGQPTVTSHPTAASFHMDRPLPLPAKITAVPLTTIPARSTILGVLPSTTRIRPGPLTQSAPIKLQSIAPIQLQTTLAASLPGACPAKLKPQPVVAASPVVSSPPAPSPARPEAQSPVKSWVPPQPESKPQPAVLLKSMPVVQTARPLEPSKVPAAVSPQMMLSPSIAPVHIKKEIEDSDCIEPKMEIDESVASRNTEILNLLNKQTNMSSCVKMEEDPLPRSYSGYSSSSSCSGSPAPPQSPTYHMAPTPAVVSIKEEEMLSDFSDEEEYDRFKLLSPEEQVRVKRRRYNNRVAAQRCRQRKRDYFQGLKKEIQEWECSNTQLKYEIHTLHKELKNLGKIWSEHTKQCETAMALQKKKHRKHKRNRTATATSPSTPTSACSHANASSTSNPSTCEPSAAPVPIVVN